MCNCRDLTLPFSSLCLIPAFFLLTDSPSGLLDPARVAPGHRPLPLPALSLDHTSTHTPAIGAPHRLVHLPAQNAAARAIDPTAAQGRRSSARRGVVWHALLRSTAKTGKLRPGTPMGHHGAASWLPYIPTL